MAGSKRTAVAAAAGVLALGAGIGIASYAAADPTAQPSPSSSTGAETHNGGPPGPGGQHGRGHVGRAELATALAAKLGVDEAEVSKAIAAFHEADKQTPGERPERDARDAALAAALAKSLGIDESAVKAALAEIRTEQSAARTAALEARLDEAVDSGTLTRAEADAVLKAVEKGVVRVH